MQADFFKIKRRNTIFFYSVLLVIIVFFMMITEFDPTAGFFSIFKAIKWSVSNFYPDVKSLEKLPRILPKMRETVFMAIASTTLAAIFSVIFAMFGSKTTKVNNPLSLISRGIASLFRNIPVVAWAMVLLFSFSQSALTGLFALFFTTFGFLTRVFIETIDETANESVEALRASGASYLQTIFQAVIPSSLPQMLSWVLFMIETNIRSSTLVGLLTGTGIGFSFDIYYKSFQYNVASLIVVIIVISVLLIEMISNYIRRAIL